MSHTGPRRRDSEALLVYSEEDVANILSDCYVDLRELTDDETAAEAVDIVYSRLTDDFYAHE